MPDSENVSKRTQRIFNRLSLRKQKGRVIYEYGFKQAPIGISSGTYLNRGVGMVPVFFTSNRILKYNENNEDKVDMCGRGINYGDSGGKSSRSYLSGFSWGEKVQHKEVLRLKKVVYLMSRFRETDFW